MCQLLFYSKSYSWSIHLDIWPSQTRWTRSRSWQWRLQRFFWVDPQSCLRVQWQQKHVLRCKNSNQPSKRTHKENLFTPLSALLSEFHMKQIQKYEYCRCIVSKTLQTDRRKQKQMVKTSVKTKNEGSMINSGFCFSKRNSVNILNEIVHIGNCLHTTWMGSRFKI